MDPNILASRKIGLNEINSALQNWNVNLPTGTLYGPQRAYNVMANGQLMNAEAFRSSIVAVRRGVPCAPRGS